MIKKVLFLCTVLFQMPGIEATKSTIRTFPRRQPSLLDVLGYSKNLSPNTLKKMRREALEECAQGMVIKSFHKNTLTK